MNSIRDLDLKVAEILGWTRVKEMPLGEVVMGYPNAEKRRGGIYEVTCGACQASHKHLLMAMFKAWATWIAVRDLSSGHEIPTD